MIRMPEWPEVETVLQTVLPKVKGKKIKNVQIMHRDIVGWPESPHCFEQELCGDTVIAGKRRGKYLIFLLAKGKKLVLHLRMTGVLQYYDTYPSEIMGHTHLIAFFSGGGSLHFVDPRRFGRIYLVGPSEVDKAGGLLNLGIEPLSPNFNLSYLFQLLQGKKGCIKGILLDQRVLAGLGNIYTDEVLYSSKIHPLEKGINISKEKCDILLAAIKRILNEAISLRGTTFRNYRDGSGAMGRFQNFLRVYGRQGEPCHSCGTPIMKIKVVGRSSFFCPHCQRFG